MAKTIGPGKVTFNKENIGRCLCQGCQVQAESKCVAGKKGHLAAALARPALKREEIPGVYCSVGPATCQDLSFAKPCSCFECPVYADHKLADGLPNCYYCLNGPPTFD
jgi:hypothetical protein